MNDLRRTFCSTLAASGTFRIINSRQIVLHMNRIKLTLLHAQHTSDTTIVAGLANLFALCIAAAGHAISLAHRNQLDQMHRTGVDTGATCRTFFGINYCHTVYDMNCIKLTCLHAGTVAHTAVSTLLFTSTRYDRNFSAVSVSIILILETDFVADTGTFDKCRLAL